MRNVVACVIALFASVGVCEAADWFPGQTGQYHLLPRDQDTQSLTLVGKADAACAGQYALFAVDEYGQKDTIPFVVPSRTVFLITDAMFSGHTGIQYGGMTPIVSLAGLNVAPGSYDKASFLASRPLVGNTIEYFAGEGSLGSGAAIAANSKICAHLNFVADQWGNGGYNMGLDSLVVHGTLVDNYRTSAPPYLSW
jgi:hypothetical protein